MTARPLRDEPWTSDDTEAAWLLADIAASRAAHPAGRAGYVPMSAPPMPDYRHFGYAIKAYVAVLLIGAGFLLGITVRPWVAIPLIWVGCLLGVRLAVIHHRTGEKP